MPPGFPSQCHHLLAVEFQVDYLISLCLTFFSYIIKITWGLMTWHIKHLRQCPIQAGIYQIWAFYLLLSSLQFFQWENWGCDIFILSLYFSWFTPAPIPSPSAAVRNALLYSSLNFHLSGAISNTESSMKSFLTTLGPMASQFLILPTIESVPSNVVQEVFLLYHACYSYLSAPSTNAMRFYVLPDPCPMINIH